MEAAGQLHLKPVQPACIACVLYLGLRFAGLELYENVLSPDEQTNMIHIIEDWVVQVSLVAKPWG